MYNLCILTWLAIIKESKHQYFIEWQKQKTSNHVKAVTSALTPIAQLVNRKSAAYRVYLIQQSLEDLHLLCISF